MIINSNEYYSPNRNINQNRRNYLKDSLIDFGDQNGNSFSDHRCQNNINNYIKQIEK